MGLSKFSAAPFDHKPIIFRIRKKGEPPFLLNLLDVPAVATYWRKALISHTKGMPEPVRRAVSGHEGDGAPLRGPHLALMPLGAVGYPQADGRLVGLAVALPSGLDPEVREGVLEVLDRVKELRLGRLGLLELARVRDEHPSPPDLRAGVWTGWPGGATLWSTVTPVAFDRHPKAKDPAACQEEVARILMKACLDAGLPRPREVVVMPASGHLGVPPAHLFPRLSRKEGGERRQAHALLLFEGPVVGPVLVGAGRYRGYGVFRPLRGC